MREVVKSECVVGVGKAFVVVLSCLLLFRVVARGVVASALLALLRRCFDFFPGRWNVK